MRTAVARTAVVTAILFLVHVSVWAQPGGTPIVTVSTAALSKYITRIGKIPYSSAVSQTDINVSFPGSGLYVDLWGSTGFDGKQTFGREIDFSVGYADANMDVGAAYYNLIPLEKFSGDVFDLYAEAHHRFNLGSHALTPYAKASGLIATTDAGRNSAFIGALGVRYVWLLHPSVNLFHSVEFVYNTPIYGGNSGLAARYDASLNLKLSETVTLSPVVLRAATPVTHIRDRHPDVAVGARVAVSFR